MPQHSLLWFMRFTTSRGFGQREDSFFKVMLRVKRCNEEGRRLAHDGARKVLEGITSLKKSYVLQRKKTKS